jgi:Fur family peroxide stress response transcriptional regulator
MIPDKNLIISRNSRQRSAIVRLLGSTKSHPTAAWLYERLRGEFPALSLGTVYRNLAFLADRGQVRVLSSGSGVDRFDADVSAHYHVICPECGKVEDIPLEPDDGLNARAEAASGYRVASHRLDFFGVCPACRDRHTGS